MTLKTLLALCLLLSTSACAALTNGGGLMGNKAASGGCYTIYDPNGLKLTFCSDGANNVAIK